MRFQKVVTILYLAMSLPTMLNVLFFFPDGNTWDKCHLNTARVNDHAISFISLFKLIKSSIFPQSTDCPWIKCCISFTFVYVRKMLRNVTKSMLEKYNQEPKHGHLIVLHLSTQKQRKTTPNGSWGNTKFIDQLRVVCLIYLSGIMIVIGRCKVSRYTNGLPFLWKLTILMLFLLLMLLLLEMRVQEVPGSHHAQIDLKHSMLQKITLNFKYSL